MTAAGGAIIDGTENVIIYCLCIRNNVAVGTTARWYFNGIRITRDSNTNNQPYLRSVVPSQFIIPSFTSITVGRYSCSHTNTFFEASSSHIDLTSPGKYVRMCINFNKLLNFSSFPGKFNKLIHYYLKTRHS